MKPMSIEALRHLRSGGRVRFEGDKEVFLEPSPPGPSMAELIAQGYLSPTGRRKIGMPPEMAMPYGTEANTYAVNVAMRRGKQISDQLMQIDALNVRLKVYQGVAIIGWAAAILLAMGV